MFVVGNTYKFKLTAQKDSVTWNLSSATVKLYLKKPSGTVLTKTATVSDAANGIADFTTATTDLDAAGIWSRSWEITDGAILQESDPIKFTVIEGIV